MKENISLQYSDFIWSCDMWLGGSSFKDEMVGSSSSPSSSSVSITSVKNCTQHCQLGFPTHVFWLRFPMKAHRFDKDFNHLATQNNLCVGNYQAS